MFSRLTKFVLFLHGTGKLILYKKKILVFFLLIKILKTKGQTRSILVQNNRTVVILFIIVNIIQDSKITDQNRKKPQEIISKCRSWAKKGWGWGGSKTS